MLPSPRRDDGTLASDAERDWTCAQLQEACVQGRLTTEELAERIGRALSARTRSELETLLRDLPAPAGTAALPPAGKRWHLGLMGSTKRSGRWRVPAESWWTSVMGGCRLDLTKAVFESPVTVINVMAGMGTVEIRVPRGFEVDVIGTALMGGRQVRLEGPPPPPGAPVIRLRIVSCLGKVRVTDRESFRGRLRQY
jgi:hypothetical protein